MELEPTPTAEPPPRFCPRCGAAVDPATTTCPRCAGGARAPGSGAAASSEPPASLRLPFALYFLLLLVNLVVAATGSSSARAMLVTDVIDTLLVVGFVFASGPTTIAALKRPARPHWYVIAALCVLVTYPLAHFAVMLLHRWFGIPVLGYLEEFTDAGLGLPIALLSICVQPAIVEELAFRGVILGSLAAVLGTASAVWVSAVIFAILHVSIPSFPHLLVLGVVLGWLRVRTGSMYPGMVLHFLHNFCVILVEFLET